MDDFDLSGRIGQLFIYPIKSCAGLALQQSPLTQSGLQWDRQWMVVDSEGAFLTQRALPRMALVQPRLEGETLVLQAPGMAQLALPMVASGTGIAVQVWRDRVQAIDLGAHAAQWFGEFLGQTCRLVQFDPAVQRLANRDWTDGVAAPVHFADGYPLLVVSQAALDDLNARLLGRGEGPVGIERFRPNIVIDGFAAHDEDHAGPLHITTSDGLVQLVPVKPCVRCPIPDIDPASAKPGHAVGDALRTYRQDARMDGGITFGMNAIVTEGVGRWLRVGQRVAAKLGF